MHKITFIPNALLEGAKEGDKIKRTIREQSDWYESASVMVTLIMILTYQGCNTLDLRATQQFSNVHLFQVGGLALWPHQMALKQHFPADIDSGDYDCNNVAMMFWCN